MDEVMSTERRRLLRKGSQIWMKCLRLDDVLSYLQQVDVIDDGVADYVKNQPNVQQGRCELIRQLERRGNKAFVHFYHALNFSGQKTLGLFLVDMLTDEEKLESNTYINDCEALREVNGNGIVQYARNDDRRAICYDKEGFSYSANIVNSPSTSAQERFYESELRGVLDDLVVESIDNNSNTGLDSVVFDEQKIYRNFSTPRGLALIINNRNFKAMTERVGTEIDERNLMNLFGQLGYQLSISKDLTAKGMLQTIQSFAKRQEHSVFDSCVVCVLTHGENNELYGIDDIAVSVNEFISHLNALNCPALAHKPKVFILQACRGQRYDPGIVVDTDQTDALVGSCFGFASSKTSSCGANISKKVPIEADFLIAYATVPGYVSWRNNIRGSWFIQSICEIFAKFAKHSDILEMLTLVNKRVAEVYESSRDSYKQVPECATRLRRKFFFFPGLSAPSFTTSSC